MKQTFYGLDVVLLPKEQRGKELHEQGKVIEINGHRSGGSFYQMGDYSFYDRVVREIKRNIGDKLLLIPFDPEWELHSKSSEESRKARIEQHNEQLKRTKQWQEQIQNNPQDNFFAIHDFLIDRLEWNEEHAEKFKTSQSALYLRAAQKAGLNVDSCITSYFFGGLARYTIKTLDPNWKKRLSTSQKADEPLAMLEPGEVPPTKLQEKYLPSEKIGLFWDSYNKNGEFLIGKERLFNDFFSESIMNNKGLLYFYSEMLPKTERTLDKFFPKSFLYGLGMHTEEGFKNWLKSIKGELVVKKPLTEAHGIGVEFMTRPKVKQYVRSPFFDNSQNAIDAGYQKLTLDYILGAEDMTRDTVVFQEAIDSHEIEDPTTGEGRPACARAIVQNGKYMGSLWRSSKPRIESGSDKVGGIGFDYKILVHNVTSGAEVLPVSEEDSRLIGEIAEATIQAFEETNKRVKERVHNVSLPHFEMYKGAHNIDQDYMNLGNMMFLKNLRKGAAAHGSNVPLLLESWIKEMGSAPQSESSSLVQKLNSFYRSL